MNLPFLLFLNELAVSMKRREHYLQKLSEVTSRKFNFRILFVSFRTNFGEAFRSLCCNVAKVNLPQLNTRIILTQHLKTLVLLTGTYSQIHRDRHVQKLKDNTNLLSRYVFALNTCHGVAQENTSRKGLKMCCNVDIWDAGA